MCKKSPSEILLVQNRLSFGFREVLTQECLLSYSDTACKSETFQDGLK